MEKRQSCVGCKWLSTWRGIGFCKEAVLQAEHLVDPSTGTDRWIPRYKYGLGWLDNTAARMTQADMPCGPERMLYEVGPIMNFIFKVFFRVDLNSHLLNNKDWRGYAASTEKE